MGEKKYTSGKAVTAEIEKLIKIRNHMISSKNEVFIKALSTKEFSETIVDLKDSEIKCLARTIAKNINSLVKLAANEEKMKELKNQPRIGNHDNIVEKKTEHANDADMEKNHNSNDLPA